MRRLTKIFLTCLVCSTLALQALSVAPALAAGATLYLSPSSGSVANGSNLVVRVYEDSGSTQVNAVQANLTYPTNLLSYVSYTSSSAFSIEAENPSGNTGSLRFGRGSITARTGAQLVVSITFKAVASGGTANVSFTSGSEVIDAGNNQNILSGTSGGNYTLSKPSSPQPTSSSSGSGGAAAPADKTPPGISDIKVSNITDNSAQISWKTSEPATSEVSYGADTQHQISTTDTNLVTDHSITIGFGVLSPGSTYYFKVKSADAGGNKAQSEDLTFSTTGVKPETGEAAPTASKTRVYVAAGAGAAALLAATAGSIMLIRRRRAKTELAKHFLDKNDTNNPPPPPTTGGPTIIYPTGGPRA